jgi:predicted  nucleic acid-binding Zn-ribbon protein
MSTFEILFLILVTIFVGSSLYFAITGRIRTIAAEAKDDERYINQTQWEDQIKVLTVRMGEITSENQRLNGVVREWMNAANTYKIEIDKLNKSLEEWQKQSEEYKAKYFEVDKELKKFTTAKGNE